MTDWLERHCTCPVCRFELETEDASYERERKKRVRLRRFRYREGELERKGVIELKRIFESVGLSTSGCIDKQDMIAKLLDSGMAEVIHEVAKPSPTCSSAPTTGTSTTSNRASDSANTSSPSASGYQGLGGTPSGSTYSTSSSSSPSTSGGGGGAARGAYTLAGLRQMRVGQLRTLMKEVSVGELGSLL